MDQHDSRSGREALFTLLYVSEMVSPDAAEVDRIWRQSRMHNERDGISGVLVFDGAEFCQFLEGEEAAIVSLLHRLERDPRHRRMRVLQFGPTARGRRFASWRLGYAFVADPSAIAAIEAARDEGPLDAFEHWVPLLAASER